MSLPMSIEPKITSLLAGDTDTVEIEAPETLLPEVIELEFPDSETLQPEDIQPK